MKKLISFLAILTLTLIFASSCSSDVMHQNVIPDNANGVAVLDAKQMLMEMDFDIEDLRGTEIENIGIDFQYPLYFFVSAEGNIGFVVRLNDATGFESCFEETRHRDNLTWGVKDGFLACHDEKRALIMGIDLSWDDQKVQKEMTMLMAKESVECEHFKELADIDGSFKARCSIKSLPTGGFSLEDYLQMSLTEGEKDDINIKDIDFNSLYLNIVSSIKPNEISLACTYDCSDPKIESLLGQATKQLKTVSYVASNYIPKDNVALMYMGMNGEKLYEFLKSQNEIAPYLGMLNSFADINSMLNAIDGDVALVINEYNDSDVKYAIFTQVNNTQFLNTRMKNLLNQFDIICDEYKEDNLLSYTNAEELSFGKTNNRFYFSELQKEENVTFYTWVDMRKVMKELPHGFMHDNPDESPIGLAEEISEASIFATKEKIKLTIVLEHNLNEIIKKWIQ